MCTHMHWIKNKYSGKTLLVKCGKCPACMQEKADKRTRRILNHSSAGYKALFITLTYSPDCLPYVDLNLNKSLSPDVEGFYSIPIFRRSKVRYFKSYPKRVLARDIEKNIAPHLRLENDGFIINHMRVHKDDFNPYLFSYLKQPKGGKSFTRGVCYFPDIQNFFKRLRINLTRYYNYEKSLSYFCCSEYGPYSDRPHFHVLLYVPSSDVDFLRPIICKSWPYADCYLTREYIEEAINASSYVSSYVNCSNSRISPLSSTCFAQKHSYSQGFGVGNDCFSLLSLLEKTASHNLRYSYQADISNTPCILTRVIPKYVINRYFPQFKGHSILNNDEVSKFLLSSKLLAGLVKARCITGEFRLEDNGRIDYSFEWTDDDIKNWSVRMRNIFLKFHDELGWSLEVFETHYPQLYVRAWSVYMSNLYVDLHKDIYDIREYLDFYDNPADINNFPTDLSDKLDVSEFQYDVNRRKLFLSESIRLTDKYFKYDKYRKATNSLQSNMKIGTKQLDSNV